MVIFYLFLLMFLLSLSNIYLIWFFMEILFLFFFLIVLNYEIKNIGLIIYYFFQSIMSLLLFISFVFFFEKIIFLLLVAKLGLFPFFYWVIVVSMKVGYIANLFVLSLQKFSILWLMWLTMGVSMIYIFLFVYTSIIFVVLNLLLVSDLWLVLVYSSIVNTALLVMSVYGSHMLNAMMLYLLMIFLIIYLIKVMDSYFEILLLILLFLVVPPFVLFYMKIMLVYSMDFSMKLIFFIFMFDVFILFYYFTLLFMKFMLMESSILIYFMNFLTIFLILFFSNCVALIIFYKS